jgi:hypothetical protein
VSLGALSPHLNRLFHLRLIVIPTESRVFWAIVYLKRRYLTTQLLISYQDSNTFYPWQSIFFNTARQCLFVKCLLLTISHQLQKVTQYLWSRVEKNEPSLPWGLSPHGNSCPKSSFLPPMTSSIRLEPSISYYQEHGSETYRSRVGNKVYFRDT